MVAEVDPTLKRLAEPMTSTRLCLKTNRTPDHLEEPLWYLEGFGMVEHIDGVWRKTEQSYQPYFTTAGDMRVTT